MQPNLINFFLAARVVRTTYKVATTAVLMYYIVNRMLNKQPLVYEEKQKYQRPY